MSERVDRLPPGASQRLLGFMLEGQEYGLVLDDVERVLPLVEVSSLPEAPKVVEGVVNLHGEVLPVVDLRLRFGLPPRDRTRSGRLVVARTARRRLVLPVDGVSGLREVAAEMIHAPESVIPGSRHLSGIAVIDGGLVLIQDLDAFLSLDEERVLDAALEEQDR